MTFSFELSTHTIILLSASFTAALYLVTFYRHFIMRTFRLKKIQDSAIVQKEKLPDISIIAYCRDNAEQLRNLLRSLLVQDYPAQFEIIVINDGCSEDTKDVVNLFSTKHHNLYVTFIPPQAHNLSHRKLAVTLGVKAARYDYVIFTNADAVVGSTEWLCRIAEPFSKGKDIVIGHASCITGLDKKTGAMMRRFDLLAEAAAYLGSACRKRPYRCNNYNMGYRKELFFKNKGFSKSLNLHNGDDDIFLSEIATPDNTAVVVSTPSQIRCDFYNPKKIHRDMKTSHMFTRRFTSKKAGLMMASGSWCAWIWLLSTIAAITLSCPNMFATIIATVISLSLWIIMSLSWLKLSHTLNERINPWLVVFFSLYRPFYNLYFKMRSRFGSNKNYTWM